MDNVLNKLESVLNVGYSILIELDKEEPDIEKIKLLYEKRSELLDKTKAEWNRSKNPEKSSKTCSDLEKVEDLRNIFLRLSLLEKNLNLMFESLKVRKSDFLGQIRSARTSYEDAGIKKQPMSLFLDIKIGLN